MCFSPEASFTVGAALLPAGIYCSQAAVRKDARFLPLALVPISFGIQQISEGFVWLGLNRDDGALLQQSSVVFLFFAIAFWPFWIPMCLAIAESRRPQQIVLALLALVGLAWLWLYFPVAVDPSKWLNTEIAGHSIRYNVGEIPGFVLAPRAVWRIGYLLVIVVPLSLAKFDPGGNRWANLSGGLMIATLFAIAYGFYWQAFLSVWCFFAAVVSLLLCGVFYRLPVRKSGQAPAVA
jgi:hypothetical protein